MEDKQVFERDTAFRRFLHPGVQWEESLAIVAHWLPGGEGNSKSCGKSDSNSWLGMAGQGFSPDNRTNKMYVKLTPEVHFF
jgi:hypothetical protein